MDVNKNFNPFLEWVKLEASNRSARNAKDYFVPSDSALETIYNYFGIENPDILLSDAEDMKKVREEFVKFWYEGSFANNKIEYDGGMVDGIELENDDLYLERNIHVQFIDGFLSSDTLNARLERALVVTKYLEDTPEKVKEYLMSGKITGKLLLNVCKKHPNICNADRQAIYKDRLLADFGVDWNKEKSYLRGWDRSIPTKDGNFYVTPARVYEQLCTFYVIVGSDGYRQVMQYHNDNLLLPTISREGDRLVRKREQNPDDLNFPKYAHLRAAPRLEPELIRLIIPISTTGRPIDPSPLHIRFVVFPYSISASFFLYGYYRREVYDDYYMRTAFGEAADPIIKLAENVELPTNYVEFKADQPELKPLLKYVPESKRSTNPVLMIVYKQ